MNGEDVPRYLLTGKITCGECGKCDGRIDVVA